MMAAQPNMDSALCKSSIIPFLVPRRKAWLTPTAGVPCSNAANIGECKSWVLSEFCTGQNSVSGQKPPTMYPENVHIVYQPRRWPNCAKFGWPRVNDVAAATSQYAKPAEICWVPQTPKPISADSGPKFAILWGHVEEVFCLTIFFLIIDTWIYVIVL